MSYLLVVDDNDELRQVVSLVLSSAGHETAQASSGHAALKAVAEREPDLIVLDLWMPGLNGLDVCRAIKTNPFTAHIPVLMLTAQSEIDYKVQGFEAGADEYLAKPFDPRELRARVAALRLVRREADRNPSSGLPGGRAIESEIARRAAQNAPFAVIYFDLDHFKAFADTFGFAIADAVISATGPALRRALQNEASGFAGHIGGDDFIVVCEAETAETVAREAALQFRAAVAEAVGAQAAARGTFVGRDRNGQEREFPLAGLASVVLLVEPSRYQSLAQLGQRAADLKRQAKAQGAGSLLVERL
jgi:DNA-binding response OmpR family regulator